MRAWIDDVPEGGGLTLDKMRRAKVMPWQSHISDALAYTMMQSLVLRIVRPLEVPCARCGSLPGTKCMIWRHSKGRIEWRPHKIRVRHAKLATEAVRALDPS